MIEIYDCNGVQRDWNWLVAHYGPLVVHPAGEGPGWRVVQIWENANPPTVGGRQQRVGAFIDTPYDAEAAAVIVVKVLGSEGQPVDGVRVAWYWPDAPEDRNAGPLNGLPAGMTPGRAYSGPTNQNGDAGFGMGGGAYYGPNEPPPEGPVGPHATWVHGKDVNTDVVFGLGMLAGTDHSSLWPVYRWGEGEPPEPPPPGCPVEEVLSRVQVVENQCAEIRALLAGA